MVALKETDPAKPFDGVRPQDYPVAYRDLLIRRCLKQKSDVPVIVDIDNFRQVYCGECFQLPPPGHVGTIRIHHRLHLIGKVNILPFRCHSCRKILQDRHPVIECGICTDYILTQRE